MRRFEHARENFFKVLYFAKATVAFSCPLRIAQQLVLWLFFAMVSNGRFSRAQPVQWKQCLTDTVINQQIPQPVKSPTQKSFYFMNDVLVEDIKAATCFQVGLANPKNQQN